MAEQAFCFVLGGILPLAGASGFSATNRATAVRGPKHVVKRGKTPVLAPEKAWQLLDSIDVRIHAGLRDRALIGLMIYTFARIRAAAGCAFFNTECRFKLMEGGALGEG